MIRTEFDDLMRAYCTSFPDFAGWCAKLLPETRESWAGMFAQVAQVDLDTAISRLRTGKLPAIPTYDRERTAHILLDHAHDCRREREHRERLAEPIEQPPPPGTRPANARQMLEEICYRIDSARANVDPLPNGEPGYLSIAECLSIAKEVTRGR